MATMRCAIDIVNESFKFCCAVRILKKFMATEHASMVGHETTRRASRNIPGEGKEKGNIPNQG